MILALLAIQATPCRVDAADLVRADNGHVRVEADRRTGTFDLTWGRYTIRGISCAARLASGETVATNDYPRHVIETRNVRDGFGTAVRITLTHFGVGKPDLRQSVWLYKGTSEAFVRLDLIRGGGAKLLVPVQAAGRADIGHDLQDLFVPYDNDAFVRYSSKSAGRTSHEVGALYDDSTRRGLIVGSIDHDTWKTRVRIGDGLRVAAGETDSGTHDQEPHGTVTGNEVRSPRISIGIYSDWRAGLERFGDLNARVKPPLPWTGGVPVGWNSWAAYKNKLTSSEALLCTDVIAQLTPLRNSGEAFVNLDSWWDNLKPAEIKAFVTHAHSRGLKAGIYWTPFVAWGDLSSKISDDPGRTYGDIALRGFSGKPLARLDGGASLDPSNPGTLAMIDRRLGQFVDQGFDFIKLDFLTHGALEGRHFDPLIQTGTQAYDLAMKRIADDLSPKRIGRPFFISLSIAPLFPSGFAHSRRISCDVFADIGASEYLMNSANYGWWAAGKLFKFNDPDHTVVDHPLGDAPTSEAEARTRITASVAAGGMLLDSDDLRDPHAVDRVRRLFTRQEVLDVARRGVPFQPVDGNTGERAGTLFVRKDGRDLLVAAFNFDRKVAKRADVVLSRLGVSGTWVARDLWTGTENGTQGTLFLELPPMACKLVRLRKAPLLRAGMPVEPQLPQVLPLPSGIPEKSQGMW